jgi:hypothetical protein
MPPFLIPQCLKWAFQQQKMYVIPETGEQNISLSKTYHSKVQEAAIAQWL